MYTKIKPYITKDIQQMSIYNKYFFHNLTEKYISIFGALFNEIEIKSQNSKSKNIMSIVPLIYSNRDKYVQRLLNDNNQEHINAHIAKLPMISYSLTDLQIDMERNLSRQQKITVKDKDTVHQTYTPTPYTLTFTVEIISKTQNELFQIIEQILPAFKPEITIIAKVIAHDTINIPIEFGGIFISDNFDGDINSRRVISATLTFTMKVYYFAPLPKAGNLIYNVDISLLDDDIAIETFHADINSDNAKEILGNKTGLQDPELTEQLEVHRIRNKK